MAQGYSATGLHAVAALRSFICAIFVVMLLEFIFSNASPLPVALLLRIWCFAIACGI